MIITEEIERLFKEIRLKIGGGIRKVELTDEAMCAILEFAINDYTIIVQNFIIESNWANFYGKNLSNIDLAHAFSTRTLDLTKDYSLFFSAQVGLQSRGTGKYELKKDYVTIEPGKQVYLIPKNRDIMKVMYVTPPTTNQALFANYGSMGIHMGGGMVGQLGGNLSGTMSMFNGHAGVGLYAINVADLHLLSRQMSNQQSFFRSDLTFKVTALESGEKLLHLFNLPNSGLGFDNIMQDYSLVGCHVWYEYYDTSNMNDKDLLDCRSKNQNIILSPDQVPMDKIHYDLLNNSGKATIKKLFLAGCLESLSLALGKFSGNINMISSPLQLNYQQYMDMANREKTEAMTDLKERLDKMSPYTVMSKQAQLVNDILAQKKGIPFSTPIMVI